MILEKGSSTHLFRCLEVEFACVCPPIILFLYDSLLFFKNRPRGFQYCIKDALAEILKIFKVKTETR